MPIAARTASVLSLAALTLSAGQAWCVPLSPGDRVTLPGSFSPGTVIRDRLIPFTIIDGSGRSRTGTIQDRVIRQADGTLVFRPSISGVGGTSSFGISRIVVEGFEGFSTDVDYDPSSFGSSAPTSCARSGDGDDLDYSFSFAPIFGGGSSRAFFARTDARQFDTAEGRINLVLEDGRSTTVVISGPVIDTTPPTVRITSPAPESCVCPFSIGLVSIDGIACDDESDMTYSVRIRRSGDADGTGWTELTPTTSEVCSTGRLALWNAASQPDGEYIVEVEAINEVGLVSTAVLEFRLNTVASPASIRTPEDGTIIGGRSCLDGTVGENCFSNYRVDYRPASGGSFLPVDASSPFYTGRVINDPIAFWDTRSVSDGDYQVRVRVSDICDNTADVLRTYEVDNTRPVARIDTPTPCEWISGQVEIKGEVFDKNLSSWVLEYTGGAQRSWRTIATGTNNVPSGGVIAEWDTSDLQRCAYTVRLRAADKARVGCIAPSGNATHDMVSVSVGCEADLNGDGKLDIFDFLAFQNLFTIGCP
ncbi:MAG: hypothetical protein HRU13_11310 [Phycisphaerales bacterium]|nr:hypothetical protein [Phycisphaerales bacterium]